MKSGALHPVFRDLAPAIARDMGKAADSLLHSAKEMHNVLRTFTKTGLGSRIETRRWWTKYDGDLYVDGLWHTILGALLLQFYISGQDPWSLMAQHKRDAGDGDEAKKEFSFKIEVLMILMCALNQNVMRSQLVIYKRLRDHHRRFIEAHAEPDGPLRFHILWSDLKDFFHLLAHVLPLSMHVCGTHVNGTTCV